MASRIINLSEPAEAAVANDLTDVRDLVVTTVLRDVFSEGLDGHMSVDLLGDWTQNKSGEVRNSGLILTTTKAGGLAIALALIHACSDDPLLTAAVEASVVCHGEK